MYFSQMPRDIGKKRYTSTGYTISRRHCQLYNLEFLHCESNTTRVKTPQNPLKNIFRFTIILHSVYYLV